MDLGQPAVKLILPRAGEMALITPWEAGIPLPVLFIGVSLNPHIPQAENTPRVLRMGNTSPGQVE